MIRTFKHKGLKEIFERGATRRVVKPFRPNTWSVRVQGPWRITFEFRNGDAYGVDLEQYH